MRNSEEYLLIFGALLLTILIEGVAIYLIKKDKRYVGYSVLVNLITNPAVNLVIFRVNHDFWLWRRWFFRGEMTAPYIIVMEIIVVVIEAVCYRAMTGESMTKSLKLSFILNLISYVLGLVLNSLLWNIYW
ncbi:MAG: hypothetical protein IJT40_02430 [Firmicutes bacterium]|nr:hypothetical protein [Bacillota bacterium]